MIGPTGLGLMFQRSDKQAPKSTSVIPDHFTALPAFGFDRGFGSIETGLNEARSGAAVSTPFFGISSLAVHAIVLKRNFLNSGRSQFR